MLLAKSSLLFSFLQLTPIMTVLSRPLSSPSVVWTYSTLTTSAYTSATPNASPVLALSGNETSQPDLYDPDEVKQDGHIADGVIVAIVVVMIILITLLVAFTCVWASKSFSLCQSFDRRFAGRSILNNRGRSCTRIPSLQDRRPTAESTTTLVENRFPFSILLRIYPVRRVPGDTHAHAQNNDSSATLVELLPVPPPVYQPNFFLNFYLLIYPSFVEMLSRYALVYVTFPPPFPLSSQTCLITMFLYP
ncbi:hypothetical protein K435DRAFT_517130 [Dendrothele bispora CBS 962.96]|uniref:Uncharacterized protein n=1 Tax=Dendrothele bispora (strain CBS 962.96) TaxID=1314807 RepID=A0A4S8M940_DENBC|nr:hypothetical protein K435DRAFT_517130 [Dendrothele bispora CBS 962.96]